MTPLTGILIGLGLLIYSVILMRNNIKQTRYSNWQMIVDLEKDATYRNKIVDNRALYYKKRNTYYEQQ